MNADATKADVSRILVGIALIAVGVALILHNLDYIHIGPIWSYWPLVLVVIGLSKISRNNYDAFWFVFFGLWLYVSINRVFDVGFSETWPLIIIAWGISLLWKASAQKQTTEIQAGGTYGR